MRQGDTEGLDRDHGQALFRVRWLWRLKLLRSGALRSTLIHDWGYKFHLKSQTPSQRGIALQPILEVSTTLTRTGLKPLRSGALLLSSTWMSA